MAILKDNPEKATGRESDKEAETEQDGAMVKEEHGKEASTLGDTASGDTELVPVEGHQEEPESEYPSGLLLIPIISALVLTVFLIALDQVSNYLLLTMSNANASLSLPPDNYCDGDSPDYRRVPDSRQSLVVWLCLLYDVRRFPIHLGQNLQILPSKDIIHRVNLCL